MSMDFTDLDAAKIPGSAPLEFKRNALDVCKNWLWTGNGVEFYCIEIVRRLQLKSIWLDEDRDVPGRKMGKLVLAIVVMEDMCDQSGVMHSACAAFLSDILTALVFLMYGVMQFSMVLNVSIHAPAKLGTTIQIVSTAVIIGESASIARAQMYDSETGQLLVTCEHHVMRPNPSEKLPEQFAVPPPDSPFVSTKPKTKSSSFSASSSNSLLSGTNASEASASPPRTSTNSDLKTRALSLLNTPQLSGRFAQEARERIQLLDIGPVNEQTGPRAKMTCMADVKIEQSLTNGLRVMHGAVAHFLLQHLTVVAREANAVTGISKFPLQTTNLSMMYHAPAAKGSTLRIVTKDLATGKRTSTTSCEIFDSHSGKLLMSGMHTQLAATRSNL